MATETQRPPARVAARARRREELLDAADRVVRRHGGEPSMEEIAAEAGITKPVLYRHFGDKDGLYDALASRYLAELAVALEPAARAGGARERFAASVDAYLSYIEREPARYRFVLAAAGRPETAGLVAEFRSGHVAECAFTADGNLRRAGLDPELAEPWAHSVAGMVRSAGIWWLEARTMPRARLAEYLTALVWDGVSALRTPPAEA